MSDELALGLLIGAVMLAWVIAAVWDHRKAKKHDHRR